MSAHWRDRLLAALHRVFDTDAHAVIALRVRHESWCAWTVADGVLTLEGPTGARTVLPLEGKSIASLAAQIEALPGYGVTAVHPDVAVRSALILIDGAGRQDASNGDAIAGYTSLLWALLHALGVGLSGAASDVPAAVDQIYLARSRGDWLDLHGSYYGVPRRVDEQDDAYVSRIIAEVLLPRSNNIAIAGALEVLFGAPRGTISVTDAPMLEYDPPLPSGHAAGYGEFDVAILEPPNRDVTLSALSEALDAFRAAGTRLRHATITWRFGPRQLGLAAIATSPIAVHSAHFTALYHQIDQSVSGTWGIAAVLPAPVTFRSVHLRG